jgi:hypothetical protein
MKCKCCNANSVPARTGNPRTDSPFALCRRCAADLCPGPDVKRYNELLALYGR